MTSQASATTRYVLALGVSIGTALLLLLGIGALGIVGDGERDWIYLAAPVVGLLVAVVSRFRPAGMAIALAAAAVTTVLAGVVAVGLVALDEATGSVFDVVMLTGMYAGLFAVAAWLFTRVSPSRSRESVA